MSRLDRALDGIENPDKEDHNDIVHMPRKGLDLSRLMSILEIFSPVTIEELVDGYHNEPKIVPKPKQKKPPTIKVEKSVDVVKKNITNVKKPTKKQLADAKLSLFKKSSMFKMFSSVLPESTMTINKDGIKEWHNKNGKRHRTDGPAIEYPNGSKEWYINGKQLTEKEFMTTIKSPESTMIIDEDGNKEWRNADGQLHRIDGPAIEYANGTKAWWLNDKRHRTDGPAIEYTNGHKEWYIDGKLHRADGPAIEYSDGTKAWWIDGRRHRTDGPALEYEDGTKAWWLNDKRHRTDGPAVENTNGHKEWYIDGKLHRTDGPAVEHTDGYKSWWVHGKLHRTDGPAVENTNGHKEWWIDGKMHRTDGPAIEYADGNKQWFIDGKRHRLDGPAVESIDGYKSWYLDGKLHRIDGPAIEYTNGHKEWCIDGKLHRTDGPAVENINGRKDWYINGKQLTEEEFGSYLSLQLTPCVNE